MSRPFKSKMPARPVGQKHLPPSKSDNYGALRSLTGNAAVDVNLTWFWNDPADPTEDGGGGAYGLHNPNPGPNGYRWIMDGRRCRPMTRAELRRTRWRASEVHLWRRGPSSRSERPRSYWDLLGYVKRNGGTIVGELKSAAFGQQPWIMRQLVATARRHNHAPWYKGLPGGLQQQECANTVAAGGQYAIIFGKKVKGRAARVAAAKKITASWKVKPSAVW